MIILFVKKKKKKNNQINLGGIHITSTEKEKTKQK